MPIRIAARHSILALFAVLILLFQACARGPQVSREDLNVLLITLDTTRADPLGCYGNRDGLTPNLDALAREGVVFEQTIAPVPLTAPSHASILTGLYPLHHHVRMNGFFRLDDEYVAVTETLHEAGLSTAAILAAYVLKHVFQLDQGFEYYDDDLSRGQQKTFFSIVERRADAVNRSAFSWLEKNGDRRFFLWVHYFDPHAPYDPPAGYDIHGEDSFGRYKGEIAYMDEQLGELLAKLRTMGIYDRTVVIAAGDHGEAFGEHDEYGHGLVIYDTTLRVPMIMKLPNIDGFSCRSGRRVKERVSLVDIAPTILDLLGLETQQPMDGRSLVPLMEGREKDPERPIYAESAQAKLTWHWSQLAAVYSGDWKYVLAPTPGLYDLAGDPSETTSLADGSPAQADRMRSMLLNLVSRPASMSGTAVFEMDAEAEERLRSLGYVTPSSLRDEDLLQIESNLEAACRTGRDPRDMMEFINLLTVSMNHLDANQPGRALRTLRRAREIAGEDYPEILGHTANAYIQLKLFDAAIETYERILQIHPNSGGVMGNLALAYHQVGQSAKAVDILEEAIRRSPDLYDLHVNLANIYDDRHQFDRADREYQRALELTPTAGGKKDRVKFNVAVSLFRRERYAEAQDLLEEILKNRPDDRDARRLLKRISGRGAGVGSEPG